MSTARTGFYDRHIAPRLVHGACSLNLVTAQRRRVVPEAKGIVLEIGIGSGLNLPHYDPTRVLKVIGVDPDPTLTNMGKRKIKKAGFEVDILRESAEDIPLEDNMVDTALVTYTFCSIPNVEAALAEIRRVLKPRGRMLFCEHGRSHQPNTAKWQDRLNPAWSSIAGGCNLNRNVTRLIQNAGFRLESIENYKLPFVPSLIGFHYVGEARPR